MRDKSREKQNRIKNEEKKKTPKFTISMQKKLVVLFMLVLLAFAGLSVRIMMISQENRQEYQKQVLSQQEYSSKTLPYRRGTIYDANGLTLATSEKVYNLVIDSKVIMSKDAYFEPTMQALAQAFPELDMTAIRTYVQNHSASAYYVPLKQLSLERKLAFTELQEDEENKESAYIKGVWFEEEYKRVYPNGSMASDAIGFTTSDNTGMFGLEEYYNEVLNGTTGREYGYLNSDSDLKRTTKPAVDGYSIISTIDVNVQSVVEKYLKQFNDEHEDEYREGNGANNLGCIVMEVNTGNILAMASYPNFDLNSPYDLSAFYTESEIASLKEEGTYYDTLNALWRNFCISDTYEPGSTFKPFTVAMALENGIISTNATFECTGSLTVGGHDIHCNNGRGHKVVTLTDALAKSCNVAMMKISEKVGPELFSTEQELFNFGLKTNIDIAGEARTVGLLYDETMGASDLATNSFGQNFNVTMIQMITGFCSLINGGYYYEPHMVSRIETAGGAVVENIEPRILKQTVSQSTSDLIVEYCNAVVTSGTGKSARPAGYAIGGKTGTAQTLPRGNDEYVVSFMGYAPAENPEIAIYVVVDRANAEEQDNSRFAQGIARNILTEILPYLNIYMTEELTAEEEQELADRKLANTLYYNPDYVPEAEGTEEDIQQEDSETGTEEEPPFWIDFEKNADGFYIDPENGALIDPETGTVVSGGRDAISE